MKEKILEIVNHKHKLSGGSCGTYLKDVADELKIEPEELEILATEIKEVAIRKGIHGKLLMIKKVNIYEENNKKEIEENRFRISKW